MAMNKIRGAFAVPRKGETFELRAGLVYAAPSTMRWLLCHNRRRMMLTIETALSMPTNGMYINEAFNAGQQRGKGVVADSVTARNRFRRLLWP